MTTATKVEKSQTYSGVILPPPPSNEEYNSWPEFDSKSNTASTQEEPWPQLSGCNMEHINYQEKTPLPRKQSSPDTTRKQSKNNNSNMTQKKATCKPDYTILMMKKDSKDCINKKTQTRNKSATHYQLSQFLPYKRPKQKNIKDSITSLRPKIVSFKIMNSCIYLFIFADS